MNVTTTPIRQGAELDLVGSRCSWSVRASVRLDGELALVVVDHLTGDMVLAELLDPAATTEHYR